MKTALAAIVTLALGLTGLAQSVHAQEFSTENMRELEAVNKHWATQTRMAASLVHGKIVIVMMDGDSARLDFMRATARTLSLISRGSPKAILMDVLVGKSGNAEVQELFDRLYPTVVLTNRSEMKRQGAMGTLVLGNPVVALPQSWGVFGLLDPCEQGTGPHAAFLTWETSSGIYTLPYHANCARWGGQYGLLKTVTNWRGERFIPFQYFGNTFFTKISSQEILNGQVAPGEFQGKIVLMGSTLQQNNGEIDRHPTSMGMIDGVELLAHAIATLMTTLKY